MHLQTAFSLFTVSLILPFANAGQVSKVSKVRANPLNGRDVAECVDGQGSGCDELGPWTDADECLAQCYGAEADTGDICQGSCNTIQVMSGVGPMTCFCDGSE